MGFCLGLIGCWLLCDAIYSLSLYLGAKGYNGKKQTWRRDHWVRVVRGLLGITLIVSGYNSI